MRELVGLAQSRWTASMVMAMAAVLVGQSVAAQALSLHDRPWTGSVIREAGQPPIPIFDGWYPNDDGSHTLCFGYYSMNTGEDVYIPRGPHNYIEPREFDGLQPEFFEHIPEPPFQYRRRYCVMSITIPADFGTQRVTWTIQRPDGPSYEPLSVPGWVAPYYRMDELVSPGRQSSAPGMAFSEGAEMSRGRDGLFAGEPVRVGVGQPATLSVWLDYPATDLWVGWARHQGPGTVTFSEVDQVFDPTLGPAINTAVFDQPGRYLIRVQSMRDPVEGLEYHCCWTNGFIEVLVE